MSHEESIALSTRAMCAKRTRDGEDKVETVDESERPMVDDNAAGHSVESTARRLEQYIKIAFRHVKLLAAAVILLMLVYILVHNVFASADQKKDVPEKALQTLLSILGSANGVAALQDREQWRMTKTTNNSTTH